MIIEILQYIAGVFVLIGCVFSLLAAIGVLRFPDLYTRLHAATKTGVVGAGFVLLALSVAGLMPITASPEPISSPSMVLAAMPLRSSVG